MNPSSEHLPRKVRVVGLVEETYDARSVLVEPLADFAHEFGYTPGQFITVRVPDHGRGAARCYSLSSSPLVDSTLKFTVKRVHDGHGSNWLCGDLSIGDELEVLPPAGVFTVHSLDQSVVLVAGGSGVTPIISIAKTVLFGGTGSVFIVYANRDEKSVIFAAELRELTEKFADRLTVVHVLESVQGYPTFDGLRDLIAPFADRTMYVCGPVPLMDLSRSVFSALGVDHSRVHVERFVSLSSNPFETATATVNPSQDGSVGAVSVQVSIDGDQKTVTWPRSKRLLDALLDAGIDAPYSCREGACSACVCALTSGKVELAHNEVLEQQDIDDGYILACQAEAVSDDIAIEY
ncbi:ferredoxin--NADP reductase [Rhodococcus sp. P1Y]|uniref:ferredoxin--NADP reductase n=1 Tax=Rhodococcus sp. P1Y TaxID=1302308 RepID=UPI001F3CA332|nr:ferredoxin--NADP reductase [Rhodococcus sp. P1Y]